jgi:hypothetical protein
MTPLQNDPNSTKARRKIEKVASRAAGHGARIRILCEIGCRIQVSIPTLIHENASSRAGVGDHFRSPSGAVWNSCFGGQGHHDEGTKVHTGPAGSHSVYNRSIIENPNTASAVGGIANTRHAAPCNTGTSVQAPLEAASRVLHGFLGLRGASPGFPRKAPNTE